MKEISFYALLLLISSCTVKKKEVDSTPEIIHISNVDTIEVSARANKFYYDDKNFLEAKLCFDTLLSFDSTNGAYYYRRGYSKSIIYDDNGALSDYHLSLKHKFKDPQKSYLNIGVMYTFKKKYDSAIFYYNKCLEIEPDNYKAIFGKNEALDFLKEK